MGYKILCNNCKELADEEHYLLGRDLKPYCLSCDTAYRESQPEKVTDKTDILISNTIRVGTKIQSGQRGRKGVIISIKGRKALIHWKKGKNKEQSLLMVKDRTTLKNKWFKIVEY